MCINRFTVLDAVTQGYGKNIFCIHLQTVSLSTWRVTGAYE